MPSHYINRSWLIINWIPGNQFERNLDQNNDKCWWEHWIWQCRLGNDGHFAMIPMRFWMHFFLLCRHLGGKSHCGDKTILRPSYLHNGISYTGKMTSLYWIAALVPSMTYEIDHKISLMKTQITVQKYKRTLLCQSYQYKKRLKSLYKIIFRDRRHDMAVLYWDTLLWSPRWSPRHVIKRLNA